MTTLTTLDKLKVILEKAFDLYGVSPEERDPRELEHKDDAYPLPQEYLQHLLWMADQIPIFLKGGRERKAMRWMGYLQGALSSPILSFVCIEELKLMNAPLALH